VTSTYDYDAFGNLLDDSATPETSYLYTGQQYDPLTELYSLRARYYDPTLGRFLSQDTYPYDYHNPAELNRYGYTANNPVNWSDRSGNMAEYTAPQRGIALPTIPALGSLAKVAFIGVTVVTIAIVAALLVSGVGGQVETETQEAPRVGTDPGETQETPPVGPDGPDWEELFELLMSGGASAIAALARAALPVAIACLLLGCAIGDDTGPDVDNCDPAVEDCDDCQYEFVGYHGTTPSAAQKLKANDFDSIPYGQNFGGASRLQFGEGIYVVKADRPEALYMAEFFAGMASQNAGERGYVILKVYVCDFSSMSRLFHRGGPGNLPGDYMKYDYIYGPITNHIAFTQVKFSPHVYDKLEFRS